MGWTCSLVGGAKRVGGGLSLKAAILTTSKATGTFISMDLRETGCQIGE